MQRKRQKLLDNTSEVYAAFYTFEKLKRAGVIPPEDEIPREPYRRAAEEIKIMKGRLNDPNFINEAFYKLGYMRAYEQRTKAAAPEYDEDVITVITKDGREELITITDDE